MIMKTMTAKRVKRTLTALLLMFVLSFGTVFAETEGQTENELNNGSQTQQTEVQTETPEVTEPAPAPAPQPASRIIKKGKYYYYKYASGKIRKKAGFVTDQGKKYYVRKGGKIRTSKTFKVKKKYYRANKYGVILTGVYKWKGKLNYSNSSGQWKKSEGLVTWNGNRYYVQKGGTILTDDAFGYNNVPYDADASGVVTRLNIPDGGGDDVVAVAKTQVGIMTGKKYWKWYFRTKFRDTDRTPWCGAFVAWCFNTAGHYDRITVAKKFGNLGYVPSYSRYANKYNKWIDKSNAAGGDIIIFGNSQHVGIIEGVYDNYIITIEGNSGPTAALGCRKPGAVTRRAYRIDSRKIKGVIRVN